MMLSYPRTIVTAVLTMMMVMMMMQMMMMMMMVMLEVLAPCSLCIEVAAAVVDAFQRR